MHLSALRRLVVPIAGAALIGLAFAPGAGAGTTPVNGKYVTYAYIAASRQGTAVYINGLVKQDYATGIIRSHGRTIYLERDLNGTWQNMLSRVTDWYGKFTVGFISVANYQYRYVVMPSGGAWGATSQAATAGPLSVNTQLAAYAKTFVGYPYRYGGRSPSSGFDCSGLTYYVYNHFGRSLAGTAQAQYNQFRRISQAEAQPGDLVFFHDSSGYVFHVGIYEGGNMMVAAATPQDGVRYQAIWSSAVTFGTITH